MNHSECLFCLHADNYRQYFCLHVVLTSALSYVLGFVSCVKSPFFKYLLNDWTLLLGIPNSTCGSCVIYMAAQERNAHPFTEQMQDEVSLKGNMRKIIANQDYCAFEISAKQAR